MRKIEETMLIWFRRIYILILWVAAMAGCQTGEANVADHESDTIAQKPEASLQQKELKINYYGHACFMITTPEGTKVLLDPVEFKGYHLPEGIEPDIVTVSHNHPDHNRTDVVAGEPTILLGCSRNHRAVNRIDTTIHEIRIHTVPSDHDPGGHGVNAIFVFEFEGLRIAHLGDLGKVMEPNQMETIAEVDILMIPVGGQFTIAGADAEKVIDQLKVKSYVIPMHYKTDAFSLPYSAEDFIQGKENVRRISGNEFIVDLSKLPQEREIVVMEYK
jgi:L-ascorbate metabolism protein UlaG (beta-lactamase superfamily)